MGSRNARKDAYLRAQIGPAETILAAGRYVLVTDRRVLFCWPLLRVGEWTHDSLAFDDITRWSEGRRHDERPLLRLEHPPHQRLVWVPAHRFLFFRWGIAAGEIPHAETTLSFAGRRDPVLRVLKGRLQLAGLAQGSRSF
jgi:hypothetical protein